MKRVRQILPVVMAATLLLAGCAGFEFDSGKRITQLHQGMSYTEVVALLGQPETTQAEPGRFMARWSLHVMWKGNVPYDLDFNNKTRRLIAWKANEEEYQKSQQRLGAVFGVSADAPGGPGAGGSTTSGGASWSRELLGRELALISSGTGHYSQTSLYLCRNGTYRMSGNSGNFGGGAFSDARRGGAGHWQATGPAHDGTLILRANNGSQRRFRVSISKDGFYLDGTKWLRGNDSGC